MRRSFIPYIAGALLFCPTGAGMAIGQAKTPPEGDRTALGFVHGGFLYASVLPHISEKDYMDPVKKGEMSVEEMYDNISFLISKSPLVKDAANESANYQLGPAVPRAQGIPQWRLAFGFYWCDSQVALKDLELFNDNDRTPEAFKRRLLHYPYAEPSGGFLPQLLLRKEWDKKNGSPVGLQPAYQDIFSDFLPTADNTELDFYLWDGRIRAWQSRWRKNKDGKREVACDSKVVEDIDAGFSEPFYVWGKPRDLIFVTASGKLYYSKKPASGKRKAAALWSDGSPRRSVLFNPDSWSYKYPDRDKNPIRGLIFDADSNKGFAFTRPKPQDKDQRPMYFEITAPLTPHSYPGFKLEKPPDNYTLQTLMEYAQFLIAKKEIKIKP